MRTLAIGVAVIVALVAANSLAAETCPFEKWQSYKGTQLYRNAPSGAYFYATERAAVDADGAPNAYHPDDVGKPCGASGAGLDCPGNAGFPGTSWWPTVLARDPAQPSKGYVQPDGPNKGFFVSKTALTDPSNASDIDPSRYVDSTTVPYLVFPGPFNSLKGTGGLGDVGVAYHTATNKWTPFIVADIGPPDPLGESSIALLKSLGGTDPNPRNGSGVAAGKVMYIVFPYSVKNRSIRWPATNQEIADQANSLLNELGGPGIFQSCSGME